MGPQSRGGQELKKKTTQHYEGQFPNTQKIICMLFCCCQSSKMIYRTLGGISITL